MGPPENDAYSAGNAGIVGLTYAAAKELFRFGITVNAHCPQGQSPAHAERAADAGCLWDVAELADVFKRDVMGDSYESHASKNAWSR